MKPRVEPAHRWWAVALVALAPLLGPPAPAAAQLPPDPSMGGSVRSREDLQELLRYYEDAIQSTAYSDDTRSAFAAEAERIRDRLTNGDFRLGDRIALSVRGEPTIPDTVAVQAGPKITLPLFGDIPLSGVLRSEVEDRITEALSAFLRDPQVEAHGLMRLSVQGAVGSPGFYVVPADMLLSEAMMVAGGVSSTADLGELRLERGPEVLMAGADVQEALRQGLSLDQLNMQAGDQLVVPDQSAGSFLPALGLILGLASSVTFIIIQLAR